MAKHFSNYLISISKDPTAMSALRADPMAAMKAAGLTDAEQAVLMQGDSDQIREIMAKELGVDSSIIKPFYTITFSLVKVHVNVNIRE
jgi:hypothetical protein